MTEFLPHTHRGKVTPQVREAAKRCLDIEDISIAELRLMPYVQYVMMNDQEIVPARVNREERRILQKWRVKGWIEGGAGGLAMTKEFWTALHEILWVGYVACEDVRGKGKEARNDRD